MIRRNIKTIKMIRLEDWFRPADKIFRIFKSDCLDYYDKDKRRVFIDRGSKILFVAHIDTVLPPKIKGQKKSKIFAQGLDDRLGCWVGYKLSYQLNTDLLLTDNEESAMSTIQYHNCKKYNWVAEFDKSHNDVVTYCVGSVKLEEALKEFFQIGFGTFSDICWLDTKAACFNMGIGYYKEHSFDSWADLNNTKNQVNQFRKFFHKYKDQAFKRDEKQFIEFYEGNSCYSYFEPTSFKHRDNCDFCGKYTKVVQVVYCEELLYLCDACQKQSEFWGLKQNGGADTQKDAVNDAVDMCPNCFEPLTENDEYCPNCFILVEPKGNR